ncbi:MAG: 4a-hydroxytetrahydrobiopterin dehydratase [Candidatus Levybacteria bacterium]|nr:4a-hydroxytetrahydrobiopterin dehydratase [Candidatus Levybacteria bacterium]
MDLTKKHCVPCEGGTPPLSNEKEDEMLKLIQGWMLVRKGTHKITRQFKFKDFKKAMEFVNKIAALAENEGHHPDIKIVYNKVQLGLFTHSVGGLSENDFIMASKINELPES